MRISAEDKANLKAARAVCSEIAPLMKMTYKRLMDIYEKTSNPKAREKIAMMAIGFSKDKKTRVAVLQAYMNPETEVPTQLSA